MDSMVQERFEEITGKDMGILLSTLNKNEENIFREQVIEDMNIVEQKLHELQSKISYSFKTTSEPAKKGCSYCCGCMLFCIGFGIGVVLTFYLIAVGSQYGIYSARVLISQGHAAEALTFLNGVEVMAPLNPEIY